MEINYLKLLRDNPDLNPNSSDKVIRNKPLSMGEILSLETNFNSGKQFPIVLRELLFLAGDFCYVLDYGGEPDSQLHLQEWSRRRMMKKGKLISRPFYVIDIYNALDQFVFIYLDEGEDPPVYEAVYAGINESGIETLNGWIHKLKPKLSEYINVSVEQVKKGQNPF